MKPEQSNSPDAGLDQVLASWKVAEPLPPRFAENVWNRIAREEHRSPAGVLTGWLDWLRRGMLRPALAGTYVAVLLITGMGFGYWRAQVTNERTIAQLGVRYVHMIDPYQMPRQ